VVAALRTKVRSLSAISHAFLCLTLSQFLGARHGLNLTGKLARIAQQEKELIEKMKLKQADNKHEVFQEHSTSRPSKRSRKNPLAELNSSKDESSDDAVEKTLNGETDYVLNSRKRKKKDAKTEEHLVTKINGIGLTELEAAAAAMQSPEESTEQPYNGTPVRKSKKAKKHKFLATVQEDDSTTVESPVKKSRKKKKGKKRRLSGDVEPELAKEEEPTEKSKKRVKLDESCETSSDDQDIVEKLNEEREKRDMETKITKKKKKELKRLKKIMDKKADKAIKKLTKMEV